MRVKKAKIVRLSLAIIAVVSIGMGILKIYTHYHSIFRMGPLDYIVAIGAILGGFLVLFSKSSNAISMVCVGFLTFEVIKALADFRDFNDVLLCTLGIICLSIPIIRFDKSQRRKPFFQKKTGLPPKVNQPSISDCTMPTTQF